MTPEWVRGPSISVVERHAGNVLPVPASFLRRLPERGFTLVELLVTIIVIGILAGMALLAFVTVRQNAENRASQTELQSAANTARIVWYQEGPALFDDEAALLATLTAAYPGIDWVSWQGQGGFQGAGHRLRGNTDPLGGGLGAHEASETWVALPLAYGRMRGLPVWIPPTRSPTATPSPSGTSSPSPSATSPSPSSSPGSPTPSSPSSSPSTSASEPDSPSPTDPEPSGEPGGRLTPTVHVGSARDGRVLQLKTLSLSGSWFCIYDISERVTGADRAWPPGRYYLNGNDCGLSGW